MRMIRFFLAALLLCLLLPCCALGEEMVAAALTPIDMPPDAQGQILELYCGPTQGFYRHGEQTLDTGKPYVLFGQYDCWAMAAQGIDNAFGPIGWVEAGSILNIPYDPQLAFEDGFSAMIEEDAQATNHPLAENPFEDWNATLSAGTQVTVLAQLGKWLYVQTEIEDAPARVFIPANTIF